MKTMIERLDITKRSPGKSYRREIICKVIEETVKIECTKKEMEPKQTSWKKKDSANAEFHSGNDQSKVWKTDEEISDIYSERVRSTVKDICDLHIKTAKKYELYQRILTRQKTLLKLSLKIYQSS